MCLLLRFPCLMLRTTHAGVLRYRAWQQLPCLLGAFPSPASLPWLLCPLSVRSISMTATALPISFLCATAPPPTCLSKLHVRDSPNFSMHPPFPFSGRLYHIFCTSFGSLLPGLMHHLLLRFAPGHSASFVQLPVLKLLPPQQSLKHRVRSILRVQVRHASAEAHAALAILALRVLQISPLLASHQRAATFEGTRPSLLQARHTARIS